MKVYLAIAWDWNVSEILGIYSTKKKAKTRADKEPMGTTSVDEIEVDK